MLHEFAVGGTRTAACTRMQLDAKFANARPAVEIADTVIALSGTDDGLCRDNVVLRQQNRTCSLKIR